MLTIFNNLGLNISREKIVDLLAINNSGISAYDLIRVSKHFKIDAKGVKGSPKLLKSSELPCICHSIKDKNLYHYIVILEKKKDTIKIMDPASGIEEVSLEYLEEISTGIFIIFEKHIIEKNKDIRFKKVIIELFKSNKALIKISIVLSFLFIFISLVFNYYLKIILSYFDAQNKMLFLIFITFIIICIIKNIVDFIKNVIILKLNNNIDSKITSKVIKHILYLPYGYFIKRTTGELISITNDIENFKNIIIKIFIICTVDLILLFLLMIYISFYNPLFIPLFLALSIIIILITLKFQYIFNNKYTKLKTTKIKFSSKLIDSFTSYDTIKNLHIENKVYQKINNQYNKVIDTDKKYTYKYHVYNFIISLLEESFYLIIILASVLSFFKVEALNIVLLSSLFFMILNLIKDICENISLYKMYQTSVIKVLDILEIKEEKFQETKLSEINKIEFKNVGYVYNNKEIIKNINFSINKGKHLFITGKSGIGKSTLMKLLLRYYENTNGDILIDNISIKNLSLDFIRDNITYASQNETLFIDTIYNNISMIKDDEEEIKSVLETVLFEAKVDIKTFILEENGLNISGGERKKIILARAILKAKNILVLDETLNEIDIKEEAKIIKNIKTEYPYLTIVLISHRDINSNLFNEKIEIKEGGVNERIK